MHTPFGPVHGALRAKPGKGGIMEKICIVKRRKPIQEGPMPPEEGPVDRTPSPFLTIELTPQQAEIIRSNAHFRHLYAGETAPIFLNLHFNDGIPQKMLRAKDICQMLQVSRHTIDKLVRTGQIKSYRIGRLRRFSTEDVMDYLATGFDAGKLRSVHVDIVARSKREFETFSR